MPPSIYQQLWDTDLQHNGCTVSARGPDGSWINPEADILLDEQHELSGPGSDHAPNPLFFRVNNDKLENPTYSALKSLMNNYVFNARISEDHLGDNEIEDREREIFLDRILDTAVMETARSYISDDLGIPLTPVEFKDSIRRLWFEIYTNHYNNTPVPFCSGFEHIMVGESKGNPGKKGIGGYHCWLKYYWDQKSERVNFNGYNYDNQLNRLSPQGAAVPHVATISMTYEPLDMDGNSMGKKRKDMGGFFVGPSPELLIALPVVAYYESESGLFFVGNGTTTREQTEKEVEINDALFRLVLYRETLPNQDRGERLRSFFPKFIKLKTAVPDPIPPDDIQQGRVAITRILANPVNPEEGREWVEIENCGEEIVQLDGWTLRDHAGRTEALHFSLKPGKRMQVPVLRTSPETMQLTNSGGSVSVVDNHGNVISKVSYPRSQDGEIMIFS